MNPLLQALFALVIGAIALSVGLPMLLDAQMQPAQNDAGNQLAVMQAAGAAYIRNNFATLTTNIAVGANQAVSPADLVADGDLAKSFVDANVFGQQHVLVIIHPTATQLEGMVYTYGGDQIPDNVAIRVAQAGPPNATVLLASDTTNFEGAAGGELVPALPFQVIPTPPTTPNYTITAGHIGAHILPASYEAEAPFLNRYATGNVDDNTMHTAQYMDGNTLYMGASGATTGGGNIEMAGGNLNAATTVTATQKVTSPILADPGGVDRVVPAGTSQINTLNASGNVTVTGTVQASIYTY